MFKVFTVLCFILSFPISTAHADNAADAQYVQMIEQSKSMPADFDFTKVRDLYVKSSLYNPLESFAQTMNFPGYFKAAGKDDVTTKANIEKYFSDNFAMFGAQSAAIEYFKAVGDQKQVTYHEWAFKGLLKAFLDSGHGGGSAEGAYRAVNKIEEYTYLKFAGVRSKGHSTAIVNHHSYDVLTGSNEKGEQGEIWFDNADFYGKGLNIPGMMKK